MVEGRSKVEEQVSWNLSQEISSQIASLLRTGRRHAINGNGLGCYFAYKEITILITHHFKPEQKGNVDKLEKAIDQVCLKIKSFIFSDEEEDDAFEITSDKKNTRMRLHDLKNKKYLLIEKYRKLILNLLDSYGYLMERKEESSSMME